MNQLKKKLKTHLHRQKTDDNCLARLIQVADEAQGTHLY
jgi:hypothetical protein